MVSQRNATWALRVPALFMALMAGVIPARAQRVPFVSSHPAEPGYVSLSGTLTYGFSPYREEDSFPSANLVGMLHPESDIPPVFRGLLQEMWRASATFRRQWIRVAEARVRIVVTFDPLCKMSGAHAQSEISRKSDLRVRVSLGVVGRAAIEHFAHELEHVLEQLDEVDLEEAVKHHVHGASMKGRWALFETRRAIVVGKLVAIEVDAYQDWR
jgi:hypothetical protein